MCPLNRPINLDEARAAPSQIFPSAYPLSLPNIQRWKSLVEAVRQVPLCILRNGEIFILWEMKMVWCSLLARGSAGMTSFFHTVTFTLV